MFISIIFSIIYHYKKEKKKSFCNEKPLRVLKLLNVLLGFTVIKVFSDKILFDFSVVGSSSGFTVIDSSLGSAVLFFSQNAVLSSSEKMKKYSHDTNTKYFIENICHQFPDL